MFIMTLALGVIGNDLGSLDPSPEKALGRFTQPAVMYPVYPLGSAIPD